MRAPMNDESLMRLDIDAMNSGLQAYREDLRYTRADALRFAELWNIHKVATVATVATVNGFPVVCITELAA